MADSQTAAQHFRDLNAVEIAPQPEEIREYAETHQVCIYNVSPYQFVYQHPLVGKLVIKACPEGKPYSEPTIVKGLIPFGVRTDMKTAELRHESGKRFALDVLQIGPFMRREQSLVNAGVFIAASDTFNVDRPLDWVKSGKCSDKPTLKELERAQEAFRKADEALIAAADKHWGEGPTQPTTPHMGHSNITPQMREACLRRGQNREWAKPLLSLIECPGCGEMVKPGIKKHVACGWRFDLKGFEGEEKKA